MTYRQPALFPLVTRAVPPSLLFSGDAALRSDQVRRIRAMPGSVEWACFCARHIDGWPDKPRTSRSPDRALPETPDPAVR